MNAVDLEPDVVDIHGIGNAIAERKHSVARVQGKLARSVLETVDDAEGKAGHLVAACLAYGARGAVVEQGRRMASVDQRDGMARGIKDGGYQGDEAVGDAGLV